MVCTLYSTGCPRCKVLANKLNEAGIQYEVERDLDKLTEVGIYYVPVLEVDGRKMNFHDAIQWINAQGVKNT